MRHLVCVYSIASYMLASSFPSSSVTLASQPIAFLSVDSSHLRAPPPCSMAAELQLPCCRLSDCGSSVCSFQHVSRSVGEKFRMQAATECGPAGHRLLLSHRERSLRLPTQTEPHGAQVTQRAHRRSQPRSVSFGTVCIQRNSIKR